MWYKNSDKKIDKDTRYYLDIDLQSGRILELGCDDRFILWKQKLARSHHYRIFLTKGQYNKLEKALSEWR